LFLRLFRKSYDSAQKIITDDLGFRKVQDETRLLTENQKQTRLEICEQLLTCYKSEGEAFCITLYATKLGCIIIPWNPNKPIWSGRKEESASIKTEIRFSAGKILAIVFFYFKGILHIDFLYDRRTVNAANYCQLLDETKLAYRRKNANF